MLPQFEEPVDVGDTRAELLTFLNSVVRMMRATPYGPAMQGLASRIATDPELTGTSVSVYRTMPARDQSTIGAYRQQMVVERLFTGMLNAAAIGLYPLLRYMGFTEVFCLGMDMSMLGTMEYAAPYTEKQHRLLNLDYSTLPRPPRLVSVDSGSDAQFTLISGRSGRLLAE